MPKRAPLLISMDERDDPHYKPRAVAKALPAPRYSLLADVIFHPLFFPAALVTVMLLCGLAQRH